MAKMAIRPRQHRKLARIQPSSRARLSTPTILHPLRQISSETVSGTSPTYSFFAEWSSTVQTVATPRSPAATSFVEVGENASP